MSDTKPLVLKFNSDFYSDTDWELHTTYFGESCYCFECKSLIASVTAESTQSYQWNVFNRSMFMIGVSGGIVAQGVEPSMHNAMHMCMNVLASFYDLKEIQSCSKQS